MNATARSSAREVTLDVNTILTGGRTVPGIVEEHSFDRIEEAAHDAEPGASVNSVLRMSQ